MNRQAEKLLLQAVVLLLCLSPLVFGLHGIIAGVAQYGGGPTRDADSHYRYLSGLFIGVGIMAASCISGIERKQERFRWVVIIVACGGLARLAGIAIGGLPSPGHLGGLFTELVVVPLVGVWQARLARRYR